MRNTLFGFIVGVFITAFALMVFKYDDLTINDQPNQSAETEELAADADYNYDYSSDAGGRILTYGGPFRGRQKIDPYIFTAKNAFGLVRHDQLINFTPETVNSVCFANEQQEGQQFGRLTIKVLLQPEYRQRMIETMEQNIGQDLTFEFVGHEVSGLIPVKETLETANQVFALERPENIDLYNRAPEVVFYADNRNKRTIMEMARYLSPNKIPDGCTKDFDPSQIVWWDKTVYYFWTASAPSNSNQ